MKRNEIAENNHSRQKILKSISLILALIIAIALLSIVFLADQKFLGRVVRAFQRMSRTEIYDNPAHDLTQPDINTQTREMLKSRTR